MKKIIISISLMILVISLMGFVNAIPNPAPVYCTNMGYTYNETSCIFSDGNSCDIWKFYNGECGQGYVKELPCSKQGESLSPGHKCCEGLVSIGVKTGTGSDGICKAIVGAWSICSPCGDGVCYSETEDNCNCPADCLTSTTCTDSDGGINYYAKGFTTNLKTQDVFWDKCDGSSVSEQFCKNGETRFELFKCPNGCKDGACVEETLDMDKCLNNQDNYWDQETNSCKGGYSKKIIPKLCIDSDGGKNIYQYAHTFGFRSYSSASDPSRDLRIRTGGADSCISDKQVIENYCDENGFIQTAYLDCQNGCKDGACIKEEQIKETIRCLFENSNEEQQCYLAGQWGVEDEGTKFCKGKEMCDITYLGYEGEKVTWKSTCGGYQYTIQDGNPEKISFDCGDGESNISIIQNKGFRYAYWQCYDGAENKVGDGNSCYASESFARKAKEFCEGHCYKDNSKCGVNSFSVSGECYLDEVVKPDCSLLNCANAYYDTVLESCSCGPVFSEDEIYCKKWSEENSVSKIKCDNGGQWMRYNDGHCEYQCSTEPILVCKDSCPLDGKCYPFGYRKSGKYCTDNGGFEEQLTSDENCDNNFECSSNVCVSGKCIDEGFLEKIMNWFRKLFGG